MLKAKQKHLNSPFLAHQQTGANTVLLSGGVWQNLWLVSLFRFYLPETITMLTHQQLPAHDGNIAVGQLAVAGIV